MIYLFVVVVSFYFILISFICSHVHLFTCFSTLSSFPSTLDIPCSSVHLFYCSPPGFLLNDHSNFIKKYWLIKEY